MTALAWVESLSTVLGESARRVDSLPDEVAIECDAAHLLAVTTALRDHPELGFDTLVDLCGVDYLHYGRSEWKTFTATGSGFSRGVDRRSESEGCEPGRRFAVGVDRKNRADGGGF